MYLNTPTRKGVGPGRGFVPSRAVPRSFLFSVSSSQGEKKTAAERHPVHRPLYRALTVTEWTGLVTCKKCYTGMQTLVTEEMAWGGHMGTPLSAQFLYKPKVFLSTSRRYRIDLPEPRPLSTAPNSTAPLPTQQPCPWLQGP